MLKLDPAFPVAAGIAAMDMGALFRLVVFVMIVIVIIVVMVMVVIMVVVIVLMLMLMREADGDVPVIVEKGERRCSP
ncbi:hypothetical protein ACFQ4K_02685 [Tistrella bauzanensis]